MKHVDFRKRLDALYTEHPMIARSKRKTVNEVLYVLRQDKEFDYNVSMVEDGTWTCIPSVKETFIPVRTLAKHVVDIRCDDDDDFDCPEICLTFTVEK